MSFPGLISGPECALPSNPLSQVLKLTEGDRSVQQDRIAGPSTPRPLLHLPGTSAPGATEHDLALARQFFQGNSTGQSTRPGLVSSPQLPLSEFARLVEMNTRAHADLGDALFREQQQRQPLHSAYFNQAKESSIWAAEFSAANPSTATSSAQRNFPTPLDVQLPPQSINTAFTATGLHSMNAYQGFSHVMAPQFPSTIDWKGKGKNREVDFESAFAQAAASLEPTQAGSSQAENAAADTTETLEHAKESTAAAERTVDPLNSSAIEEYLTNLETAPETEEEMAKWEAQFNQIMSAERDELEHDYGAAMQKAWENGMKDVEMKENLDQSGFPVVGPYAFDPNNKFMASEYNSTLTEAKELLNNGGSLSEAALLLEAAIQKGDLGEGGYEAWVLLGECRSMDECETPALQALTEGVKRAESAGCAGPGMLSLAISYTNEQYNRASYRMLLRWLHARFPSLPVPEETFGAISQNAMWDIHARVTDIFIGLARSQHQQGVVDPEVQIGLGILFYTDGDFDRAKDCFATALAARPSDALLWNRLGSSLSNGNKPEEALSAYRQALQLRPTYTRAIYNVGVACMNIGAHKEAAEHFLSALAMQKSTGEGSSNQIWMTLRRALAEMNREDLAAISHPINHPGFDLYRKEGFDF